MAEILENLDLRKGVSQEVMEISLKGTMATGDTIDLKSDSPKVVVMSQIRNVLVQDATGVSKTATFDVATGIITLGTLVTGVHNVIVFGK